MELKDFIAVRGKAELFRVISRTPKGVVVETLNESRSKFKIDQNLQVLILQDITIYGSGKDDIFLHEIFKNIYLKYAFKPTVDLKSEGREMREFFREVAPGHDEERVYTSDIKKALKWYLQMAAYYPQVLEDLSKEEESPETPVAEEKSETEAPTVEEIPETPEEKPEA
jgi:hypothetical protein